MQTHQQSQPIYFSQQQSANADTSASSMPYAPHMMHQVQPSHHQQQQQQQYQQHDNNFVNYSSQGQNTSDSSFDMGFGQQSQVMNGTGYPGQQSQSQSQQEHYHSLQSSEPLSLPPDYGQAPSYASQPNPVSQQSSMPQAAYSSVRTNKISATGMVFSLPQMQGNLGHPNNGAGQTGGVAPTNGSSGPQFCVVVAHPSQSANGSENSSKVCIGRQTIFVVLPVSNHSFCSSLTQTCRIIGCGDPALSRRPYCQRHSGNRMCEHEGCGKCAQGSTRYCIAHGGGRRCTFPGCDKGARDKFFCAAHGGGKRCKSDGCNKSAVGGSQLCTSHGGGRRCSVDGCDKSAQSSTKFCVKHGGGKKCAHDGCDKVARGRTQYCAAHGGGVRCKLAGCNRVAIGKVQLCRAHGGGTRPRRSSKNGGSSNDSVEGQSVDYFEDGDFDDHHEAMPGFADMTHV